MYVRFLLLTFNLIGPMDKSKFLPNSAKSVTARAKQFIADSVVYLSKEHEAAIGKALQKIMLNPF